MKRFGSAMLKVLVALCGVAIIFGIVWIINGGSIYVLKAIRLYWSVAKENIIESIIFYAMFGIALFVIELVTHGEKRRSSKKEDK